MKKFMILIIAVCMMISCAAAEGIDLSGMSFDELVALKARVNLAIWESEGWQEVKVPIGMYQVGKDIPAGKWTVRCAVASYAFVYFGDELEKGGAEIDYHGSTYGQSIIVSPDYKRYEADKDQTEFSFTVEAGDYIQIDKAAVLFSPYTGVPDLGFK